MQKCTFIGNLGNDPRIVNFENGGKVANFSVGVTERGYKLKNGTEVPARTEWFDCVAKNGLADIVEKYTKKGHKVYIEAEKRTRRWTDQNGVERKAEEFILKNLELLTPKDARNAPVPAADPYVGAPAEEFKQREDDDLPF